MHTVADRALITPAANKLREVTGEMCLSAVNGACGASLRQSTSATPMPPTLLPAPLPRSVSTARGLPSSKVLLLELLPLTITPVLSKLSVPLPEPPSNAEQGGDNP